MACLGLGGRWDPELGFGAVVRLRGHRLEGACSGGPPGSLAGVLAAACPQAGNNAASIPRAGQPGGPPATWRPGPRRLSTGRAGARTSPAPRVLPGPASQWPDAAAAPFLPRWAGPGPLPPAMGLGVRPTRRCHVCHPPSTHEHLSKIPGGRGRAAAAASGPPSPAASARGEQETKVAFSSPSWAGGGASPAPSAPGRPASGLPGWPRPRPRRPGPRGPVDAGGHSRGARGLAPGPALLCLPRGLAGATAAAFTALLWTSSPSSCARRGGPVRAGLSSRLEQTPPNTERSSAHARSVCGCFCSEIRQQSLLEDLGLQRQAHGAEIIKTFS
ncbi:translation initiation factor IF-2 isoform X3 [Bos taurus]|uniref:translation initiation factor IF-2 isoform X3 n=1 Tax=Bos taurus TaxID=9913 RepID=UPI0028CB430A|nr:translation initiation factor IF-2 isoform X3 [Bos taurus]